MFISLKIHNEIKKRKTHMAPLPSVMRRQTFVLYKKNNINLVCIRRHIIPSRHSTTRNSKLKRRQKAHNTTGQIKHR